MADPALCRKTAQHCLRLAERARSAKEKRALLKIAQTWSRLAEETEAYEAILCKWDEGASGDRKLWQGG